MERTWKLLQGEERRLLYIFVGFSVSREGLKAWLTGTSGPLWNFLCVSAELGIGLKDGHLMAFTGS